MRQSQDGADYTNAKNLKLLQIGCGKIVVLIEENYILHVLDVSNSSFTRARGLNGVNGVSV